MTDTHVPVATAPAAVVPAVREVWVETDAEPDDMLALRILQRRNLRLSHIVVGESQKPELKIRQLRRGKYLAVQVGAQPQLIQGMPSTKNHPTDPVLSLESKDSSDNATDDMKDVLGMDAYAPQLLAYLQTHERPVLVMLKPPRELLMLMLQQNTRSLASQIMDLLASKAVLYLYGSFNLRTLGLTKDQLYAFVATFHWVYLFESFHAVGSANSINQHTMPALYKHWQARLAEADMDPALASLAGWVRAWNEHIVADQLPWVDKSEQAAKIVRNVSDNIDFQFVMADMILALFVEHESMSLVDLLAPETPVTWDAKGFTQKTADLNDCSLVRLFCQKLPHADLERMLMQYL